MHSGFRGTYFGDAYELDDQEKLTFRLRKRVRTKLGHDGVEFQKRRFGLLDLLLPAAILLLFSCVCFDQSTFGNIRGTVQDGSGSVLPDTTVVVHSIAENTDCNGSTDAVGEFNFENVKPGAYRVTVHRHGFNDTVVTSTSLAARQELRIPLSALQSIEYEGNRTGQVALRLDF